MTEGVEVALDPSELELDPAAMQARYVLSGTFCLVQILVGNFGKFPCQTERLFSSHSKLASSLVDQETYVVAQEDKEMEMEILCKWMVISVRFTVSFTAQQGSVRTELIGPCEVPLLSPTPHPKDQTRPAHRELHALLFSIDVWVL